MDEVSRDWESTQLYIRIANIQPYLIKYGPNTHAEIIKWSAAILKKIYDKCANSFIGTISTHDFIGMCKTKNMVELFMQVRETFRTKISSYYSKKDLDNEETLSFNGNDGKKVSFGLIKFIAVVADKKLRVKRVILSEHARICDAIEATDDEVVVITNDMIQEISVAHHKY
jgi:hypothetical protein